MTQPVDRKVPVNQPPANAAALVGETLAFLVAWRRILGGAGQWPTAEVEKLVEQSRALQARARELGVGGLAHHLHTCDECLDAEVVDRAELSRRLRNVSELTSQLRQETDPVRSSRPPAVAPEAPVRIVPTESPATRQVVVSAAAAPATEATPEAPEVPLAAPTPPAIPRTEAIPAPRVEAAVARLPSIEQTLLEAPKGDSPALDAARLDVTRPLVPKPEAPKRESPLASSMPPQGAAAVPRVNVAPRPRSTRTGSATTMASERGAPAAAIKALHPLPATPPLLSPTPLPLAPTPLPATPPLLSSTLLPLAPTPLPATAQPSAPTPVAPAVITSLAPVTAPAAPTVPSPMREVGSSPRHPPARGSAPSTPLVLPTIPIEPKPMPPSVIEAPSPSVEPEPRARLDTLVGLTEAEADEIEPARSSRPPVYVPPTSPPPPRRDVRRPELSVMAIVGSEPAASAHARDLELRRDRISRPGLPPLSLEPPLESVPPPSSEIAELPWQSSWGRSPFRWWHLPIVLGALAVAGVLWLELRDPAPRSASLAPPESGESRDQTSLAPLPAPGEAGEKLRALVARIHAYGAKESSELRDLIDREASAIGRALGQPCAGPAACAAAERARALLEPRAAIAGSSDAPEPSRALGAWLAGLALPGIGVRDVPTVQERVEFHTRYTTGREALQVLLFQCAAHRQAIGDSLVHHELPLDLLALPMAESGCSPDAESRVGARGLWQLTPEAAAAYHLRIQTEVIDERVSTVKATEAALRFLADVHAKLGSWELALAGYHLGPFELTAQLVHAEPETDFWRLVAQGRFNEQAATHVGRIQAFALIVANLDHFDFERPETREGDATAELEVPGGTRLGLVARAAGSSITRLRELNPELLADALPDAPGEKIRLLVPLESMRRARQRLPSLIANDDGSDRCVPYSFDWGRQRFTKPMAERCEQTNADGVR